MALVYLIQVMTLLFFLGGIIFLYMGLRIRKKVLEKTMHKKKDRKELRHGSVPFIDERFQETKDMQERFSKLKDHKFDEELSVN